VSKSISFVSNVNSISCFLFIKKEANMARPRSRTQKQDEQLFNKFKKYIDNTTIPIIAEFAYMNDIERQYLYDNKIFSTLLKKCIAKKEANLEKGALTGKLNPTMAIFSLKQIGWKDKQADELQQQPVINISLKGVSNGKAD